MDLFPLDKVKLLRKELAMHPAYAAVGTMEDLTSFMRLHAYCVWDFMSLVKYLQNQFAPARIPWLPHGDVKVRRFINEIVLEEESDEGLPLEDGSVVYTSHFELYLSAMEEVCKGSSREIREFVDLVASSSLETAMQEFTIPQPAREFMTTTFDFIKSGKPHVIAAAFALGREHVIPEMFRALLDTMKITKDQAEVLGLIAAYQLEDETLRERVLRCVVSLSGRDVDRLRHFLECACEDYRNLILWHEHAEEARRKFFMK